APTHKQQTTSNPQTLTHNELPTHKFQPTNNNQAPRKKPKQPNNQPMTKQGGAFVWSLVDCCSFCLCSLWVGACGLELTAQRSWLFKRIRVERRTEFEVGQVHLEHGLAVARDLHAAEVLHAVDGLEVAERADIRHLRRLLRLLDLRLALQRQAGRLVV